jgi:hypothetical protein
MAGKLETKLSPAQALLIFRRSAYDFRARSINSIS